MDPRIRPLAYDQTPTEAHPELDHFHAERGTYPNMFLTMARRPAMMATAAAHLRAVFTTGTVAPRLKEMLAVRVSQINDCMY